MFLSRLPGIRPAILLGSLLLGAIAPLAAEEAQPASEVGANARALAEILQDPQARQALIDRLLAIAEEAEAGPAPEPGGTQPPSEGKVAAETAAEAPVLSPDLPAGLIREIAERTKSMAESTSALVLQLARSLGDLGALLAGRRILDWPGIRAAAVSLGSVILVTLATLWLLRALVRPLHGSLARRAEGRGWARRAALLLGSSLIDALLVAAAWAGGYGFSLFVDDPGRVDLRQGLFLNAFLAIELIKTLMRALSAPRFGALRILPMSDTTANYWYFWLSRLAGLLGYGLLVVVPIANLHLSFEAGRALKLLIPLTAAIMAILVILQNRVAVRAALERSADAREGRFVARAQILIGRAWHLLAIGYVAALFVIWMTRPADAVGFMLSASGRSAVAILAGVLVSLFVSRAITGGMRLPEDIRQRLPLLESRLNALVPTILKVVRSVVLVAVAVAIAQAWELVDVVAWLDSGSGQELLGRLLTAAVILLLAVAIWLGFASWIEYRLSPQATQVPSARARTLLSLLKNAVTIVLATLAVMLTLSQLGLDIGPLLAGAGVVGLAIGFGAQKLVQDIITGIFLQFENAMNEGDVVTAAGISGVVEKLTIRSVGLRDLDGVYHLIPFSSVDSLSNFMRGFAFHVAEIGVAYRESIPEVKAMMQKAFDQLAEGEHGADILPPFEMHGITRFGDSAVVVRARIKTRPGAQWAVGRAYNEIVKELFDQAGIEIPFPHLTVYMGEDKQGDAPALRVRQERDGAEPGGAGPEPAG